MRRTDREERAPPQGKPRAPLYARLPRPAAAGGRYGIGALIEGIGDRQIFWGAIGLAALLRIFAAQSFTVGWFDAIWQYLEPARSEEHTSELQSLMRISYAVFCLKKKNT